MEIKTLQLHKRAVYRFENIQDKFAFNEKTECFALADGTTQSFCSEKWAEIITKKFVSAPTFNSIQLIDLFTNSIRDYEESDFKFSSNPAQASLEKTKMQQGGTATFMGLQVTENNQLKVIASGDTNLFHISKGNKRQYFPYSDIELLDGNKHFINTKRLLENKIDASFFQSKTLSVSNGDLIIVATDALSRLFLKKPQIISEFVSINHFDKLHKFCLKHWEQKELEEDDISAIIIKLSNKSENLAIEPPSSFSFPKEVEEPFVPTPLTINQENNTSFMEEIRRGLNAIKRDLEDVRRKLRGHQILTLLVLGLMAINILIICSSKLKEGSTKKTAVEQMDNSEKEPSNNELKGNDSEDGSKDEELKECCLEDKSKDEEAEKCDLKDKSKDEEVKECSLKNKSKEKALENLSEVV